MPRMRVVFAALLVAAPSLASATSAEAARIARLLPLLPGPCADDAFTMERLRVGNTNRLYKLSRGGQSFLVREFGGCEALAFDRAAPGFAVSGSVRHPRGPD